MSKASRIKGQQGERELADIFSEELGINLFRNLGQERDGGSDLTVPSSLGPIGVQVKRQERAKINPWLRQARDDVANSEEEAVPVVAWRANGKKWVIAMDLEEFIKFVRECQ